MIKEKLISSKLVKKIAAAALCAVMAGSCFGTTAFAESYKYSFATSNRDSGPSKTMNKNKKEYTNVTMNCPGALSANAQMEMWKEWNGSNVYCEQRQTITVGTGRRVWWYGDTVNSGKYHVTATVANNFGETVYFSGVLKNFK